MFAAGGRPAGYVDPPSGSSSPLQLFLGSFHSSPLIQNNISVHYDSQRVFQSQNKS